LIFIKSQPFALRDDALADYPLLVIVTWSTCRD